MTTPFDQTKVNAFVDTMLGILNHGALALMTSIGHRTGLFDIMATLPPSTSRHVDHNLIMHCDHQPGVTPPLIIPQHRLLSNVR